MNAIEIYENAIRMLEINGEITLGEFEEMIKPLEDVAPVVRGEWIKMDKRGNNVQCSKCRNTLDLRGVNAGRGDANYCPNCGAKMSTQSNAFSTH